MAIRPAMSCAKRTKTSYSVHHPEFGLRMKVEMGEGATASAERFSEGEEAWLSWDRETPRYVGS
jgi:hypothetical protein